MRSFRFVTLVCALAVSVFLFASKTSAQTPTPPTNISVWNELDTPVKIIAGIVALIVSFLGVPVAFLQTRKTLAEIHKLDLEAKNLQKSASPNSSAFEDKSYRIWFEEGSNGNVVNILTDPRMRGPLLVMMNFIIAFAIIGLTAFGTSIFTINQSLQNTILFVIAAILLFPIIQAAIRSKNSLNEDLNQNKDSK